MHKKICKGCFKPFTTRDKRIKRCSWECYVQTRPLPKTCFKKGHKSPSGERHPFWKGGKRIRSDRYVEVITEERYKTGARKYIFEHRLVMEKHIKRKLLPNEIVHHKNGIKHDNRIENLEIVLRKTHKGIVTCPHCLKSFSIK